MSCLLKSLLPFLPGTWWDYISQPPLQLNKTYDAKSSPMALWAPSMLHRECTSSTLPSPFPLSGTHSDPRQPCKWWQCPVGGQRSMVGGIWLPENLSGVELPHQPSSCERRGLPCSSSQLFWGLLVIRVRPFILNNPGIGTWGGVPICDVVLRVSQWMRVINHMTETFYTLYLSCNEESELKCVLVSHVTSPL